MGLVWYPGHEILRRDIVRAENCWVYDAEGKRYVDLESGVWCTSIGHAHPRVLKVLAEQPAVIAHNGFNYTSPLVEEAAAEVLARAGLRGGDCVFLCSGSEAVEYGVRVAQMAVDRPLLMTMTDSYFGAYGSARRRSADEWHQYEWLDCPDCGGECRGDCEQWKHTPFDRIGGFLLEPGSSSGLVRFPPKALVQAIVRRVRADGGLVLVNEVTTGIGRTGEWFGFEHYGLTPDVVAMGKGIGAGYPVAATVFAPGVIDRLGGEPVPYAQSHQNDPLGAAVAREVLRVIEEEGLLQRGREIGNRLVEGLQGVQERTGRIRALRARGLMIAVELEDRGENPLTLRTHRELVERGFLVGRRPQTSVLRLDPSLTVEYEDIEAFVRTLEEILVGERD